MQIQILKNEKNESFGISEAYIWYD